MLVAISGLFVGCAAQAPPQPHESDQGQLPVSVNTPPTDSSVANQPSPSQSESGANGSMTSTSPDGVTHKTPINDIWSVGSTWGLMLEVDKPEQSIFADADISRDLSKGVFPGDYTTINVVRRLNEQLMELGVGTKAQLATVQTASGNESRTLWGYPGSTVILQPGASVIWKGSELTASGNTAVKFKIGRQGNEAVVSSIEGGTLRFSRASPDGSKVSGVLSQTDKGVVEIPDNAETK
jgi:hypothetical protein